MSKTYLRLISYVGMNKFELPSNSTFKDLKVEISKITKIKDGDLKIFLDPQYNKRLNFNDSQSLSSCGIKDGDFIHVSNEDPTVSNNKPQNQSQPSVQKQEAKSELEKQREKLGLTPKCNHSETSKCLHCMETPNYKGNIKFNCNHGLNAKCPNCLSKGLVDDVKHISFDEFLSASKQKCKGIHDPLSKCNNCMPPLEVSYKMKKNCSFHPPYPQGMCVKCIPPGVSLGRQRYRHVDYVSFMNIEEVNNFVMSWNKDLCLKQKMAFLFGYYSEDPNYAQGIRVNVEALYEPPQIGDHHGVTSLTDKDIAVVDRVAKSLTLEIVGWIFTTIDTDNETFMTSYDIKRVAEYQEQNKVMHPSGYFVTKFITCMVKPKENGDILIECCMISDTFQALVRDNIIGDCVDKKIIPVRKSEKNEMLPDIFQESKKVENFDPAFAIVQVSLLYKIKVLPMYFIYFYVFYYDFTMILACTWCSC